MQGTARLAVQLNKAQGTPEQAHKAASHFSGL